MTDAFQEIINYEDSDLSEYLTKMSIIHIFKDLIGEYPEKSVYTSLVKYIAYAYTPQSKMIHINTDWEANKRMIFEHCCVPSSLAAEVIKITKPVIATTIIRWLDFQGNQVFKELQSLKDVREQFIESLYLEQEKVDYDQKRKNATYIGELSKMIVELEQRYIQNDRSLKAQMAEVKRAVNNKNTMGVESFNIFSKQ